MDLSCNPAKVSLLGGVGVCGVLIGSVATCNWTIRTSPYGKVVTGLWQFCHTDLRGFTMCSVVSLGFNGGKGLLRLWQLYAVH